MALSGWIPSLRIDEPLEYGRTRCAPTNSAAELAARLGAARDDAASDIYETWYTSRTMAVRSRPAWGHRLDAASVADLERALDVCTALGLRCRLEVGGNASASSPRADAAHDAGADAVSGTVIYRRTTPLGELTIERDRDDALCQRVVLGTAVVESTLFTPAGQSIRAGSVALDASPRLAALLSERRFTRGPRLSDDEIAAEIDRSELPPWDVLAAFEREVGGLMEPWPDDPIGRPWLQLGLGLVMSADGEILRQWTWQDDEDEDEDGDTGVRLLLVRWPLFRWRDVELVFVGEYAHAHYVLVDRRGALWRFEHEFEQMTVVAASTRAFLELLALDELLWQRPEWASVRIDAVVGGELASRLHLSADESASDQLVQCWEAEGVWLRQHQRYGANEGSIAVVGDDIARVVEATRIARELDPKATIRVQESRPGGRARAEALRRAGLL